MDIAKCRDQVFFKEFGRALGIANGLFDRGAGKAFFQVLAGRGKHAGQGVLDGHHRLQPFGRRGKVLLDVNGHVGDIRHRIAGVTANFSKPEEIAVQAGENDQAIVAVARAERRRVERLQTGQAGLQPGCAAGDSRCAVVRQFPVIRVQPDVRSFQGTPGQGGGDGLIGEDGVGLVGRLRGAGLGVGKQGDKRE